jgi:hypothetical protein
MMPPAPGPTGWMPVWIKAVTKPSEQTFVELTDQPEAVSKTAFLWVFIAATLSTIVAGLLQALIAALGFTSQPMTIPGLEQLGPIGGSGGVAGMSLVTTICASPVAGVIAVLFFAIGVAIVQWIAKLFGGVGTFDKLAYAIAAISVPFTLVSMVVNPFNAIPYLNICTGLISFGLFIYSFVLQVMAVKGVNRFGWGAALGSVFIPFLVVVFVCGCLVIGGLMMMAPIIGNVFSEINQSLTP